MSLSISKTRFEPLKEFDLKTLHSVDISAIKVHLLAEIAFYYALKHQFKVISLNNSCHFYLDYKEEEYNFQLSILSILSLFEKFKLEIFVQNQEVIFCNDINYLKQQLSCFHSKNIQKQIKIKITKYRTKSYFVNQICSSCSD